MSEDSANVVNSHVINCPHCNNQHAIAVIWSDGDVDIVCAGCKHEERLGVE